MAAGSISGMGRGSDMGSVDRFPVLKKIESNFKAILRVQTILFPEALNADGAVNRGTVFKTELEEHVFGRVHRRKETFSRYSTR